MLTAVRQQRRVGWLEYIDPKECHPFVPLSTEFYPWSFPRVLCFISVVVSGLSPGHVFLLPLPRLYIMWMGILIELNGENLAIIWERRDNIDKPFAINLASGAHNCPLGTADPQRVSSLISGRLPGARK